MDSIAGYRIGNWQVEPALGRISRDGELVRVDARTMRLLMCLAERAGQVVSIDELLDEAWTGVIVTPDSVYQAIATLRRQLGDDPKQPAYIANVPRLGYRLIAPVEVLPHPPATVSAGPVVAERLPQTPRRSTHRPLIIAVVLLIIAGVIGGLALRQERPHSSTATAQPPARSVAVLPLLDLTDEMNEEPFADGMTEELIDRLSQVPGLRVPAPTASFYYKGKQFTVSDVARALDVAYVLDGSVRKSGTTLRVAARLVRADDGFVVWSETYDRSWDDKLMIQDDIASEVVKTLKASIDGPPAALPDQAQPRPRAGSVP
ncbi:MULTISPECIES: winged helix-turn-helix domain-containing protein [unclassified Dyella]|uniref:winged helix-turn-helix domain-containing protein n=1 Tax=unclassified Dyella TaxID=2634549 RepID=UPI000C829036|nr:MULTISPECIES: winged helix-turn-helix domain-containing protein [unclassified Dyella]MDR3446455.1 winged helix-turn-helix domain-containing protein [Dyella sp.]PMQ07449.1 Transcriptional activator CadC [Dyella sp. AD56]